MYTCCSAPNTYLVVHVLLLCTYFCCLSTSTEFNIYYCPHLPFVLSCTACYCSPLDLLFYTCCARHKIVDGSISVYSCILIVYCSILCCSAHDSC